ncbi:MAG: chromate reductase [Saprospiraceae bacterium]|jgi:chromate reductase
MITVISGTNRRKSRTFLIAKQIYELVRLRTVEHVELLNLEELPLDFIHAGMYQTEGQNKGLRKLQDHYMIPASKFIFVFPEYNGSIPGILKLFIDACSVREYKSTFYSKKAALVGVATGKAGNLRGIDHLSASLAHVGTIVLPGILPISSINEISDEEGFIIDKTTIKSMQQLVDNFLEF